MKLWQKNKSLDQQIESFTVGNDPELDQRLISFDCKASIAHAKTLNQAGILSKEETYKLVKELESIITLNEKGKFIILQAQEDCHTAIENHLTDKLGDIGKKIHTGRSRNDQVLAALRLYYLDAMNAIQAETEGFIQALADLKNRFGDVRLPGYTHTRKAMPSLIGMWADAFSESMRDNLKLLATVKEIMDQCPLGSGAGYGVPLDLDREGTAKITGFSKVQQSPIYVQLSRGKFEASLIHVLAQMLLDLNRLASDLILFSMPMFGYFKLPPEFCTGSSIMPQKINPDVLELMRAKFHEVSASEFQIFSLLTNLISGYHRDLQLTKKPVMQALDQSLECLSIITMIIQRLQVNKEKCEQDMTEELFATEKVYELVKKGMPFREAYREIAKEYEE